VIAVDTNILVYAHREDSHFHKKASAVIAELAESDRLWAIPWPCIHEFLAIVTHPRIFSPPTPLEDGLIQLECWLECPRLQLIGETVDYWQNFRKLISTAKIVGPAVHDARIASICLANGIETLWTADRDFGRMSGIEIFNPLV